jgi:CheY-like chemotaxis protein
MAGGGFFSVDALNGVHAIVVDDDPAFRDVLVSLLRYCGALVTGVGSTDDALGAMDQIRPDVLVITVGGTRRIVTLPGRVRARKPEDGGNVPIVAILRDGGESAPEGVNVILEEPLNPWELCRVVSGLLAT